MINNRVSVFTVLTFVVAIVFVFNDAVAGQATLPRTSVQQTTVVTKPVTVPTVQPTVGWTRAMPSSQQAWQRWQEASGALGRVMKAGRYKNETPGAYAKRLEKHRDRVAQLEDALKRSLSERAAPVMGKKEREKPVAFTLAKLEHKLGGLVRATQSELNRTRFTSLFGADEDFDSYVAWLEKVLNYVSNEKKPLDKRSAWYEILSNELSVAHEQIAVGTAETEPALMLLSPEEYRRRFSIIGGLETELNLSPFARLQAERAELAEETARMGESGLELMMQQKEFAPRFEESELETELQKLRTGKGQQTREAKELEKLLEQL